MPKAPSSSPAPCKRSQPDSQSPRWPRTSSQAPDSWSPSPGDGAHPATILPPTRARSSEPPTPSAPFHFRPPPAWSPRCSPASGASRLPCTSAVGPGPAPRSSPRPPPTLPSWLVHQRAHCAGVGRYRLLHEAAPVFSAACLLQPLGYVCHCGPPGVRAQCETSTPGLDRHWYLTVHDLKTPNLLEACWSQPPHCPVQVGTQFLMGARLPSPDTIAQASKRAGHELGPPRLPAAACPQDADPWQLCAASPGIALPCPVPRAPPGASWLGWGNTPILEVAPKASECTFCRGQPVVPLDRFAHPLARHGPRLDVKQPRGTLIRGSLPQNPQERLCNTHIS